MLEVVYDEQKLRLLEKSEECLDRIVIGPGRKGELYYPVRGAGQSC